MKSRFTLLLIAFCLALSSIAAESQLKDSGGRGRGSAEKPLATINKELEPSSDPALAYLEVRGPTIHGVAEEVEAKYKADVGKPKPTTTGNGLSVEGRYSANKPHHIRIAHNDGNGIIVECALH